MELPTTSELNDLIGRERILRFDRFRVAVRIVDTRAVYGRTECKVTPVEGSGEAWVFHSRLEPRTPNAGAAE